MKGYNPARPAEESQFLQVHEIFRTIQGEGPFSGHRAVFVRFSGCNLKCWFCDTAWDDENDVYYSPLDIVAKVDEIAAGARLVVITGGEPARQNLKPFIEELRRRNYKVQVETSGSIWNEAFEDLNVVLVVSPKTPGLHPKFREHFVWWKYVIKAGMTDPEDGLPLANYQRLANGNRDDSRAKPLAKPTPFAQGIESFVYITPMDEGDEALNAANRAAVAEISLRHGYIAQLQVHKELELP